MKRQEQQHHQFHVWGPDCGASGNLGNYAHFNGVAKVVMVLLMIIGRLEIFTIVALFTRAFWRK
ncbi:MAG: hypothetical protein U5L72_11120 [Bacteroidales bacterium]|nr:hypothetical protein [Bacteroidales bacterium]